MIIAITILSVLLVITILFVIAGIIHILKIQKELNSISEEQSRQNEDIRNLMIAHMTLVQALKDATEIEQLNKVYNYNKIKGEA
jgi:ABC-type uncharacterized transport system fused permease/ATPase subunit